MYISIGEVAFNDGQSVLRTPMNGNGGWISQFTTYLGEIEEWKGWNYETR